VRSLWPNPTRVTNAQVGRGGAPARARDGFSALVRRFFGARATSSATKSSLTPKSSLTDPSYRTELEMYMYSYNCIDTRAQMSCDGMVHATLGARYRHQRVPDADLWTDRMPRTCPSHQGGARTLAQPPTESEDPPPPTPRGKRQTLADNTVATLADYIPAYPAYPPQR
jgi:hypothetical protein